MPLCISVRLAVNLLVWLCEVWWKAISTQQFEGLASSSQLLISFHLYKLALSVSASLLCMYVCVYIHSYPVKMSNIAAVLG